MEYDNIKYLTYDSYYTEIHLLRKITGKTWVICKDKNKKDYFDNTKFANIWLRRELRFHIDFRYHDYVDASHREIMLWNV